ncbi:MAG: DUF1929 domain-containing protein [Planctomycetota bacterium]|nr:DUF1929 domain-containing protein [Planctomycetota bacterium]
MKKPVAWVSMFVFTLLLGLPDTAEGGQAKGAKKETQKGTATIDDWVKRCAKGVPEIKVQRRILEKANKAQRAQDIAESLRIKIEVATKILHARDSHSPFGFHEFGRFWEPIPVRVREVILEGFQHSVMGHWNVPINLPDDSHAPVHAALLKNGHVLFITHGEGDTYLWNPDDPTAFYAPDNQPTENLYCSGHAFLSDGRLFAVGGGGSSGGNALDTAWVFDRDGGTDGEWAPIPQNMKYKRWYPTVLSLGGRRMLIVGGYPNHAKVEIFHEQTSATNRFEEVSLTPPANFVQMYPGLHLMPNGQIFNTPTGFGNMGSSNWSSTNLPTDARRLTLSSATPPSGTWGELAPGVTMDSPNRVKGMSASIFLGPLGGSYITKVLVAGGYGTNTAEIVDFSSGTPSWTSTVPLPGNGRNNVNLVLLPNGTALVCGGATPAGTAVKNCAIYDPYSTSNTWQPMDGLTYKRAYHSVALLLPSGQVMVAGVDHKSIEVFNPPYWYASRPDITTFPSVIHHGQTFEVTSPQAADIDRVVLVRPMAVTHQTDTEQRVVGLQKTSSGTTLTVLAPNGSHPHPLAPRGHYMLFLVNGQGVPSKGKFVWLH